MKVKAWLLACGLAVCLLTQTAVAGPIEDANSAYARKDYTAAFHQFKHLADTGIAEAEYRLGIMFAKGEGVAQDHDKARKWIIKAAEHGFDEAQFEVGTFYELGVPVLDYTKAFEWYRKAADQGNANAQNNLGHMYEGGLGVPRDYSEAVKWYDKAADQGNVFAQLSLGFAHGIGNGVPQDFVKAYMWADIAYVGGQPVAEWARLELSNKMTPDQISEAQRLAQEWLAAHPKK